MVFSRIRPVTGSLLRFLLPWACAGCRTPLASIEDEGFCGRCWLAIPRIQGWVCRFCGVPLQDGGNLCFPCRQTPTQILIRAATVYKGPIPAAIHRFKYAGRKTLHQSLGVLIRQAWERYPELHSIEGLLPIPLYPTNYRDRGYNQAEFLAKELAAVVGKPILCDILQRTKRTKPQFQLHRTERLTNLENAFAVSGKVIVKGSHFLLVDDVCTTGTTLQECARVLRRAGAAQIKALVLARDL